MKDIYLIRHGESKGNLDGIIQGHLDFELSETGIEQANRLGQFFSQQDYDFDKIFSSDSLRASQTADIVCSYINKPIIRSEDLREINLGVWQGNKKSDIFSTQDLREKWETKPSQIHIENAENFIQAQKRVTDFILRNTQNNKKTAFFGHGTTICLFLCSILDKEPDFLWDFKHNNTGWSRIVIDNNGKIIKYNLNITSHLEITTLNWF